MWLDALQLLLPLLSNLSIPSHSEFSSRPHVPPQFTCSISATTPAFVGKGKFENDLLNQRLNQSINSPWFGGYFLNTSSILLNTSGYSIINGRCAELNGSSFGDPFGWLVLAKLSGAVTLGPEYDNRKCNFWNFSIPAQNLSLALCLESNDTIPVLWVIDTQGIEERLYFYEDFAPVQPPDADFVLPQDCFVKRPLCDGGAVVNLNAFVFHPANQFDLINEDVADLLGDTVFICVDANNTGFDHYAWVSRYTLQVWSGWGEYALCNRPAPNETGVCVGKETFSVGREAAYGIKDECGQCTNNDDVGNWYSLPTAGLCSSDTQPLGPDASKGQCSWRVLKKIKTIDGVCLLKTNGMLSACAKEFDYPFAKSKAILLQSFESDDPSQGGCPPIA